MCVMTSNPGPIVSRRLDLILFSEALEVAISAGDHALAERLADFKIPDELLAATEFLHWKRRQVDDPRWAPWSVRAVVLREQKLAIGTTNFHGPPGINGTDTAGAVEMGYEIYEAYRGSGFATEVALAMIQWAQQEHGITHFISTVLPDNLPSRRVNQKVGFVETGAIVDGEIVYELRLPGTEQS
jgi:ribosomal-protein-alanine N-acetyltransferase